MKSELTGQKLIGERINTEGEIPQKIQDYADVTLFGHNCDLTLCFTDEMGLVGLNYHDTGHEQTYRQWYGEIEERYGVPTENGSGMAPW